MELHATIPVQKRETVTQSTDESSKNFKVTRTIDEKISVSDKVDSDDPKAMGEKLFELIHTNPGDFMSNFIPEELRDEYNIRTHTEEITLHVTLSTARMEYVQAVYFAASQYARTLTELSMTRCGTSIEWVLMKWIENGYKSFHKTGQPTIEVENFGRLAEEALFTYCVYQTAGRSIENEELPEPNKTDYTKEEMLVDE